MSRPILAIFSIVSFLMCGTAFAEIEDFSGAEDYKSLAYLYEVRASELASIIDEHEKLTDGAFYKQHPASQSEMRQQRDQVLIKAKALLPELERAAAYHKKMAKLHPNAQTNRST